MPDHPYPPRDPGSGPGSSGIPGRFGPTTIDVLNRVLHTTSNSTADPSKTAHELLTMTKPSIMEIVPFGCAGYVARPDPQVEDSTLSVRGWRGTGCRD